MSRSSLPPLPSDSFVASLPPLAQHIITETNAYYEKNRDILTNFYTGKEVLAEFKDLNSQLMNRSDRLRELKNQEKKLIPEDNSHSQNLDEQKNEQDKIDTLFAQYKALYTQHEAFVNNYCSPRPTPPSTIASFNRDLAGACENIEKKYSNQAKALIIDKPCCLSNWALDLYLEKKYKWEKEHKGEELPAINVVHLVDKGMMALQDIAAREFNTLEKDLKRAKKHKNHVKTEYNLAKSNVSNVLIRIFNPSRNSEVSRTRDDYSEELKTYKVTKSDLAGKIKKAKQVLDKINIQKQLTDKILAPYIPPSIRKITSSSAMDIPTEPLNMDRKSPFRLRDLKSLPSLSISDQELNRSTFSSVSSRNISPSLTLPGESDSPALSVNGDSDSPAYSVSYSSPGSPLDPRSPSMSEEKTQLAPSSGHIETTASTLNALTHENKQAGKVQETKVEDKPIVVTFHWGTKGRAKKAPPVPGTFSPLTENKAREVTAGKAEEAPAVTIHRKPTPNADDRVFRYSIMDETSKWKVVSPEPTAAKQQSSSTPKVRKS